MSFKNTVLLFLVSSGSVACGVFQSDNTEASTLSLTPVPAQRLELESKIDLARLGGPENTLIVQYNHIFPKPGSVAKVTSRIFNVPPNRESGIPSAVQYYCETVYSFGSGTVQVTYSDATSLQVIASQVVPMNYDVTLSSPTKEGATCFPHDYPVIERDTSGTSSHANHPSVEVIPNSFITSRVFQGLYIGAKIVKNGNDFVLQGTTVKFNQPSGTLVSGEFKAPGQTNSVILVEKFTVKAIY